MLTSPIKYQEINDLLKELQNHIQAILGNKLVSLVLFGSLAAGDFDFEISDIDLSAITTTELNSDEFNKLDKMHQNFTQKNKSWNNRIEIAYTAIDALKTFKTQKSSIAIISPGEPFSIKNPSIESWIINWYLIKQHGITLFGADPKTIIPPISKAEFINAVKKQAINWRDWISHTKNSRPYQGYAILTMCRALYACTNGEQVSKKKAALWALEQLPEQSEQIQKALLWRKDYMNKDITHETTYPETVKFVLYVIELITK